MFKVLIEPVSQKPVCRNFIGIMASILLFVLVLPMSAFAVSSTTPSGDLQAVQGGLPVKAGNAGTATDKIEYDGDENFAMTFKPLDVESHTAQLAYTHLKVTSSATVENPIDFVIPGSITDSNGVSWTVVAAGYDSKYATENSSDGGGGNYDLTDAAKTDGTDFDFKKINNLVIPSTVTTLGSSCFNSWSIQNVVFDGESNLESIGYKVFSNCESLKSFTIPASVKSIVGESGAFQQSGLESIVIPSTVETITGAYTFGDCLNLKSVTFENNDSLTIESQYMFSGCESLDSIDWDGNKPQLAAYMFDKCKAIREFDFGDASVAVGDYAFNSCTSLSSLKNASNVTSLGNGAFAGCTSLQSFAGFDNLESVGDNAFNNCSALELVLLGKKCSVLGNTAFLKNAKTLNVVIGFEGQDFAFGTPDGIGHVFYSGGGRSDTAPADSVINLWFTGSIETISDNYNGNPNNASGRTAPSTSFGNDCVTFMAWNLNVFGPKDKESGVAKFFEEVIKSPPSIIKGSTIQGQATITYTGVTTIPSVIYSGTNAIPITACNSNDEQVDVEFVATRKSDGKQIDGTSIIDPGTYEIAVSKVGNVETMALFDFTIERSESAQDVYDAIAAVTVPGSADDAQVVADAYNAAQAALAAYESLTDVEKASTGNYVSLLEKIVAIDKLQVELAKAEAATVAGDRDQAKDDLAKAQAELKQAKSDLAKAQAELKQAKSDLAKAQEQPAKTSAEKLAKVTLTKKTKSTKKGKVTVAWKKVDGATGYEVKVGAKTYTVKKASTLKKTVKAAKGKKAKVQVRAFKKVGDNYQYGPWSKAKKVKVKK